MESSPGALPILTYHSLDDSGSVISVSPQTFERQMGVLQESAFRGISLAEAVQQRQELGRWPERTVVLTFDDGYESVFKYAAPTLTRCGFTATVFLVTGYIGGRNDWAESPPRIGEQNILDWEQAAELARAGWDIGAHTCSHPDLRRLDTARVKDEVQKSRVDIEERLKLTVACFAYPYGHVSSVAISAVAREFEAACGTELRRATTESLHVLPRIDMYYLRAPGRMRQFLEGRLETYLTIRRWGRLIRTAVGG